MSKELIKTLVWITIFSIAMAFLESSVVVYLRALYYPSGFEFPLQIIDYDIGATEFFREAATIIMLLSIGFIAAKNKIQRFAWFIFSFAIWDIFYYVFLKVLLDWPVSLLSWDILFLIPVTWVGPVIAPVICALLMIILGLSIVIISNKKSKVRISLYEWLLLISGSIVVIISFILDYINFLLKYYTWKEIINYSWTKDIVELTCKYIPQHFNWWIFCTGILIICVGIFFFIIKSTRIKNE
ncbi:MAG: hypothetical protein ABIJ97_12695 [Bacteroidota bacterium]